MKPSLTSIMEVLNLTRLPEDEAEIALLSAYTKAVGGQTLINICIDERSKIDGYSLEEVQMFILGYALGQKDFLDKIGGLDLTKITKNDNETIQ